MFNSIPSSCTPVSVAIKLLEDLPGPVESLNLMEQNVSVNVFWSAPLSNRSNGVISGYTLSLDGTVVCVSNRAARVFLLCNILC